MTLTSQQAALLLCCIPNLGPRRIKKLIDHCNSAINVLEAPIDKLLEINGIGPSHLKHIRSWKPYLDDLKKRGKKDKRTGFKAVYLWGRELSTRIITYSRPSDCFFSKRGS